MLKHFVILFIFLTGTLNLSAQINESDTVKFQLRVTVTGNFQRGNVQVLTIRSKIDFSYKHFKNWVFKSQNSSLYQEFAAKADNDIFSRNYLYYKPMAKVYPFAIGYISGNYRRKIKSRYFGGAGVTWQIINKKNLILKLSASAVYESTRFKGSAFNDSIYNGSAKINVWRGTLYAGGWAYLLQKHIRLNYDAYWQPALNNKNNYRTQFDIGLDFPVWKGLSFNTLFTYTHENVVITKIKQTDKILTFGLAYNFKRK
jgi:hypothetical protein